MRHGSIYIATNTHTGEQYVGQTRHSVAKRWDAHWRTATCPVSRKAKFQKALVHFGVVRASITNAIKQKGKVGRMYTLEAVA